MARGRKKHEEHTNHEAWAIPYGDLITLLLAFFVVMYAISSVNEGKYRILSEALVAAFRGNPKTLQPIEIGQRKVGENENQVAEPPKVQKDPPGVQRAAPIQTGLPKSLDPIARDLTRLAEEVERAMKDLINANLIVVKRKQFWIEIEIRTDILFPSGSAQLSATAIHTIERLAHVLAPFPNQVRVEGHTDDVPIRTVAFPSNWELSAARSSSVVRVFAANGVDPKRLAVIGYGEERPVDTNATAEGRNANRRVVIVVLSSDPERNQHELLTRSEP